MDKKIIFHLPWIIWGTIIAVLSLLPGDQLPEIKLTWVSIDKIVHIIMYSALSGFLLIGFDRHNFRSKNKLNLRDIRLYLLLTVSSFLFGLSIEFAQDWLVTKRYYDITDVVANLIGTIFGLFCFSWMGRKLI
ncbi:VanZ family protein [Crocinitomix algicola]|uniref:VanZ family protein n=1 Tax=Crocinitomix algicola TaxID=1740263 RepID=UPI000871F6EF|nr:VanZ family protein [Crocinitomix algicola]